MAHENSNEKASHAADTASAHVDTKSQVLARQAGGEEDTVAAKIATVAVVGLGAALIEAELIPGILIGVAAMIAPNIVPKIGRGLRPLLKSAVRAGYALTERARETVAEAGEQIQDIVAEVKAEQEPHQASGQTKHA